jgi:hypothetical protein
MKGCLDTSYCELKCLVEKSQDAMAVEFIYHLQTITYVHHATTA